MKDHVPRVLEIEGNENIKRVPNTTRRGFVKSLEVIEQDGKRDCLKLA